MVTRFWGKNKQIQVAGQGRTAKVPSQVGAAAVLVYVIMVWAVDLKVSNCLKVSPMSKKLKLGRSLLRSLGSRNQSQGEPDTPASRSLVKPRIFSRGFLRRSKTKPTGKI